MEIAIISLAALAASCLTLFSGFGLGTLLMPVFALFFPLEMAIAMTAVVHLANNLFKSGLLGRKAEPAVLLKFGIPAMVAALLGALLLYRLGDTGTIYTWQALGSAREITLLKLVIGLLILLFTLLELLPGFANITLHPKWLPLGGLISGFFGGLSGHQGAFRSMFLIKVGLNKEAFVATGVMLAVMVDVARISIYGFDGQLQTGLQNWPPVAAATLSAFLGAWLGAKILQKVTLRKVQLAVSCLLAVIGVLLIAGFI